MNRRQQINQSEKAWAYWKAHPSEAAEALFNVKLEPYQKDVLNALLAGEKSRVAVKSGHGVGKTAFEGMAALLYLIFREQSRVVATAPTESQLKDILWPEVAKWHQKLPDELRKQWEISSLHVKNKKYPHTWFMTGRTSNKPDNMQGFHGDNILVICEEASGVPENIFEVIEGILSNADEHGQEALLLIVGNPTQTGGEFYKAFNRNKFLYERFTVSGDSDALKLFKPSDGKCYVSKRVSKAFRETMAAKYGKISSVYDVRVRGIFPLMADDVVIPMEWAERAQYVTLPHMDLHKHELTLVMDVSRFGGDETTLGTFRGGHCIELLAWPKTSTNKCLDILTEAFFHRTDNLKVARVTIDEPGVGGGVVDGARRLGLPVTPYNGGGSMKKDLDSEADCRMFANRRSRDWWHARRAFERKGIRLPEDELLVDQLCSVKYDYFNEKIKVESKREMRERLGNDASPDRADTIIMGLAPIASLEGALPLELLDSEDAVRYGADRPTANQDF